MSSFWVLKGEAQRENLISYLRQIPLNKQCVTIAKRDRTRPQERYWHMLVGIIADHMGEDREEFKMRLKYEWLPLKTVKALNGREYLMPISTTELEPEQYSRMIEKTLALGGQLGLHMPDASMMGLDAR